jgi:hypothetical protein
MYMYHRTSGDAGCNEHGQERRHTERSEGRKEHVMQSNLLVLMVGVSGDEL